MAWSLGSLSVLSCSQLKRSSSESKGSSDSLSTRWLDGCLGLVERLDPWLAVRLVAAAIKEQSATLGISAKPRRRRSPLLMAMKALLTTCLLIASTSIPALAQKEIPKAPGHDECPLGYVNTLGTTCVSPVYYEVAPTNGEACKAGWMNIGAGYCKKKKGPLGIL